MKEFKGHNFGGKNLTPIRREVIQENFTKRKEDARLPIEGEEKKTQIELRAIELINSYLNDEMRELGINGGIDIDPAQIHILSHQAFVNFCLAKYREYPKPGQGGFSLSVEESIIVDRESGLNKQVLFRSILHEAVHLTSWRRWSINLDDNGQSQERTGYGIFIQPLFDTTGRENKYRLYGFNEAITELIARDVVTRHRDEKETQELFALPHKDGVMATSAYEEEIKLLNIIISAIAKNKNESEGAVWQRLKKGYFSGEMMHLRDIEKAFGSNSLKVLALLHSKAKGLSPEETSEKVAAYFTAKNKRERNKIKRELVG